MDQCTPLPPQHRLVKSRSGCSTCKSRKVKCDEVRPVCGNCAKRYIGLTHCEYRSPPAPRRNAARPSMPAALTARPATIADEPASRWLELRLMYHYVRTVCLELPDCNGTPAGDLWQDRVPTLAFESEVVLDTVLAISALHLQSLSHNTQELITASTRYLNRALTRHRRILASNDKKTAESLLVSAILISNIAWLQAHRRVRGEAYDLPMHAYNMIQGVSALFLWKKSWFEEAGYGWFGQEEPLAVDEHLQQSSPFLLDVQQDLDLLARRFSIGECRDYAVYDQAMKYILWLYTAVLSRKSAGHLHRFVGTMPLRLDARFIVLLKAYDPLCMALLARGIAVLKLIDYAWWIHGRDDYEVLSFDIDGICKLMPADCRWAMDWPLKVASGVINV